MSKAAVKSRSTRTTHSLESVAKTILLKTLERADSVLCRVLKADWKTSEILCSSKKTV